MAHVCRSCGAEAGAHDRFCGRCGTALAEGSAPPAEGFCRSCGAPLRPGDRFCARCGAATGAAARAEAGGEQGDRFDSGDFFDDWERRAEAPDEAKTERVHVVGRSDTAVLPEVEPSERPEGRAPPPARPEPSAGARGFPWGATFAFLGAVAVVASSALPWLTGEDAVLPRDVPVSAVLFGAPATRGPSLGLVLLGLGMAGALVALLTMAVPGLRFLRRLVGLVTLAAPVLFVVRVIAVDVVRLLDVAAAGLYVAAAGAFVQIVAGRWFGR